MLVVETAQLIWLGVYTATIAFRLKQTAKYFFLFRVQFFSAAAAAVLDKYPISDESGKKRWMVRQRGGFRDFRGPRERKIYEIGWRSAHNLTSRRCFHCWWRIDGIV